MHILRPKIPLHTTRIFYLKYALRCLAAPNQMLKYTFDLPKLILNILYRILIKIYTIAIAWLYLKTFYLLIPSFSLSDLMIIICILHTWQTNIFHLSTSERNYKFQSFFMWEKWQFLILLYVWKMHISYFFALGLSKSLTCLIDSLYII